MDTAAFFLSTTHTANQEKSLQGRTGHTVALAQLDPAMRPDVDPGRHGRHQRRDVQREIVIEVPIGSRRRTSAVLVGRRTDVCEREMLKRGWSTAVSRKDT